MSEQSLQISSEETMSDIEDLILNGYGDDFIIQDSAWFLIRLGSIVFLSSCISFKMAKNKLGLSLECYPCNTCWKKMSQPQYDLLVFISPIYSYSFLYNVLVVVADHKLIILSSSSRTSNIRSNDILTSGNFISSKNISNCQY